jgi:hypothetical protein
LNIVPVSAPRRLQNYFWSAGVELGGGGGVFCAVVVGAEGSLIPFKPSLNPFNPSPSPLPSSGQPFGAKQQKRHHGEHNQVPWLQ